MINYSNHNHHETKLKERNDKKNKNIILKMNKEWKKFIDHEMDEGNNRLVYLFLPDEAVSGLRKVEFQKYSWKEKRGLPDCYTICITFKYYDKSLIIEGEYNLIKRTCKFLFVKMNSEEVGKFILDTVIKKENEILKSLSSLFESFVYEYPLKIMTN